MLTEINTSYGRRAGRQHARARSFRRWHLAVGGVVIATLAWTVTGVAATRGSSPIKSELHRAYPEADSADHRPDSTKPKPDSTKPKPDNAKPKPHRAKPRPRRSKPKPKSGSNPTVTTAARGSSTTKPTTEPAVSTAAAGLWLPPVGARWQIQLTTPVDPAVDAPIYDIDGELNSKEVVDALHAKGRKVICYLDAGAAERYRSDSARFPASVLGATVDGWPEERWLDVRQIEQLRPVMAARMDMCKAKGFDAVDPDMVEAYAATSGFPITYQDQLAYNRFLAQLAHERGLSVGLKGDVDQIRDLVESFEFTVNEECSAFDECDVVATFARAGKAVFHIEYDQPKSAYCAKSQALGFSSLRKHLSLDAWLDAC